MLEPWPMSEVVVVAVVSIPTLYALLFVYHIVQAYKLKKTRWLELPLWFGPFILNILTFFTVIPAIYIFKATYSERMVQAFYIIPSLLLLPIIGAQLFWLSLHKLKCILTGLAHLVYIVISSFICYLIIISIHR